MKKALEWFYKGPGLLIIVVAAIIGGGLWMRHKQDAKAKAIEEKEPKHDLGKLNPQTPVDASKVQQEVDLDKRQIAPAYRSVPEEGRQTPQPTPPPIAHPKLVSFYAQVTESPTPTPTPAPTPRPAPEVWCPPSRFIPCVLINTVNSSQMDTPVVGKVERDIICVNTGGDGKDHRVITIPAGTVVSSFANGGAIRDRIPVAGTWLFVFPDNRSLKVPGIACNREADPSTMQFGDEDGSAGLKGELVETNHWANAQAFLVLLMGQANQVVTAAASSAASRGFGGGVVLPDTNAIQAKYLNQLFNGETGDSRYVHVASATEFYIFPTDSIMPRHRAIDNRASTEKEQAALPVNGDQALGQTLQEGQRELQLLRQQQLGPNENDEPHPKFHY